MATIYSTQLLAKHAASGSSIYLVPDGYTAILRDLDGWIYPAAGGPLLTLLGPLGNVLAQAEGSAITGTPLVWRGRQVLNPGDTFTVTADAASDFQVSGYLLS